MPTGEPGHVPAPQPTPRFAPRSCMAPVALALLALAAIVVAASTMSSPPWAALSTRQPEGVVKTRGIQPGGIDSHHVLLWHSLAKPPSSAAQCVLLAEPEGKPAQQTCLFANVCVNKTERSPCTECRTDPPNLRRQRQHQFACQIAVVPAELCRLCERNRSACTSWSVGVDGPLR